MLPALKAWEADVALLGQWQPGAVAMVRSLQRNGIRVAADVDGDTHRDPEFQSGTRQVCGTVDAVFVSNNPLASRVSRWNEKVVVTPGGIDLALWRGLSAAKAKEPGRVVGFAATAAHAANIEVLRPA